MSSAATLRMRELFLSSGRKVEFYFDVISPYSFVGFEILCRYIPLWRLKVEFKPMLLGGVFKATNNTPNIAVANKGRYMAEELPRLAESFALAIRVPPDNKKMLMAGALKAQRTLTALSLRRPDQMQAATRELFMKAWHHHEDVTLDDTIVSALLAAGISRAEAMSLLEAAGQEAAKERLKQVTQEAVDRGAFGAPVMVAGGELFFGSDRFELMAQRLGERWYGPSGNPYAQDIQELLEGKMSKL